jgi:hypothetical protein
MMMKSFEENVRSTHTLLTGQATNGLAAPNWPAHPNFSSEPFCVQEEILGSSPEQSLVRLTEIDSKQETSFMQLILDKIRIPAEWPRLSRTRLLSLLHGSLTSCAATIISGRAGTGKTLLATDFARRCGRRVSWYKVDASDSDLKVFFKYLIESVRRQRPGFGEQTLLPLLESATVEDMPVLAESFVFELLECGGEPLLIVIDDLHLVYDEEWVVPFFRRLLPLLPAEAHMLITGRGLPPAPLWRMRSKQMLCVIEEPTLSFTQQEAIRLFESYGLSEAHADVALEHSRGRAALLDKFGDILSSSGKAITEGFVTTERRSRKACVRQVHGHQF